MALDLPDSASEVADRSKADVQRELQTSNPFGKNSWLGAIVTSSANRIFDFYLQLNAAIKQNFPDTATGTFLTRWAAIWGKQLQAASKSSGNFIVGGGLTNPVIPVGTVINVQGVGSYISTSAATVALTQVDVIDFARTGSTVTATVASVTGLANGIFVFITGATNTDYNGSWEITVTGDDQFQFTIAATPPDEPGTPATGTFVTAVVSVESEDFGADTNLAAGTQGTLQSPIIDVDNTLTVDFGQIGGGTDQETEESLQLRTLDRIQNPVAQFNVSAIIEKAKEIPGVTRVFVQEAGTFIDSASVTIISLSGNAATATLASGVPSLESGQLVNVSGANEPEYNQSNAPILVQSDTVFKYIVEGSPSSPATGTITVEFAVPYGQVIVYFMRDNDPNPIPAGSEVTKVRDNILTIKPANTADSDVVVSAPTAQTVDFTFTELTPATSTMRSAISANLRQFFDERTSVGVDIDEDAYRSAIFNTVDPVTGDVVQSFELSAPSGDISIGVGEIGVLGNITY